MEALRQNANAHNRFILNCIFFFISSILTGDPMNTWAEEGFKLNLCQCTKTKSPDLNSKVVRNEFMLPCFLFLFFFFWNFLTSHYVANNFGRTSSQVKNLMYPLLQLKAMKKGRNLSFNATVKEVILIQMALVEKKVLICIITNKFKAQLLSK